MDLFSWGQREPPDGDETATRWIVRPAGETAWQNGSQAARRLHEDAEGRFTYETAPDLRQREPFTGEVP